MPVELVPPSPAHIPQYGRLFYDAFAGISAAHNFPHDVDSPETATRVMAMLVGRPDFYGVVAVDPAVSPDDPSPFANVRGFNFLQKSDDVGGVGPLCVAPGHQHAGLGRRLMRNVIDHALSCHGPMVRLLQAAYNLTSLSLYASMGYEVKEPILLMSIPPADAPDESVRPLTFADLDAADGLCRDVYRVSRRNELATIVRHGPAMGCLPHGKFAVSGSAPGELVAYVIPGFFGHSVARTVPDLLTCLQQTARVSPPPMHRVLVPTRTPLFPAALARGFRAVTPLSLMAIGPYDPPRDAWTPSIGF